MELIYVGFLLGVLGTGIGAVITAAIQEERRNGRLRRALISELRENQSALLRRKRTRLSRSAWDTARAMPMKDNVFSAVSAAYVAISRVAAVMELSLAPSAGEPAGSFQDVMKTGGPINYAVAIKRIEAALAPLGVHDLDEPAGTEDE